MVDVHFRCSSRANSARSFQGACPRAIYWPTSPFGGIDNNSDCVIGDIDIWNVSSSMFLLYQIPRRYWPLRVGVRDSILSPSGYHQSLSGKGSTNFHPQSKKFEFHCKANSYENRIFNCTGRTLSENQRPVYGS